jgi:hypothetical protein
MKKIIFFVAIILFGLSVNISLAQVLMPFGGRVVTAPIPGAVCPTSISFVPDSPFVITPVGVGIPGASSFIPGPFSSVPGPQTFGQIIPSAWILGLYLSVPIPDCVAPIPPLGTLPVFKATIYGTSVPIDLPL